jgi:hypothetical protein
MSDTAFSVPTSLPKASGDWPTYGNKSNDDASSALGVDEKKMAEVTRTLSDIKSREIDADERVAGQLGNLTSKALPKIEELSKTAGLEAEKMKPWNEEAEAQKRSTDPIANFASLGSVFGILASAFTHAPMENALNASAAAMNAIKAGNAEDYNRAYKAWESNTKQALDRYKIEHGAFEDAVSLLKTNMEAGQTMMRVNAIRFGNEKEKALIEQGMTKELFEYRQAMQKMALELDKDAIPRAERHAEMAVLLNNGYKPTEPNNPANGKAMEALDAYNADRDRLKKDPSVTTEMGANIRAFRTTPKEDGTLPTPDEVKDFIKDQRTTKQSTPDQVALTAYLEEHPNAKADEIKEFIFTLPGAHKGKTLSASEQAIALKKSEKEKELGRPLTSAEFDKIVAEAPKAQTVKPFSTQESTRIAYAPTLMRDMEVMNRLMDEGTGAFTGLMKQFASEYIGVNDPAGLFNAARKSAISAATSMAAQGSRSATALKAQIDTLPEVQRASDFGHKQTGLKMNELRDETQSFVNSMEAGGKRLDHDNLSRLEKMGVYPESSKDKNPLAKLAKDPASVPDADLSQLHRLEASYPPEIQSKIREERNRRAIEWEKTYGQPQ